MIFGIDARGLGCADFAGDRHPLSEDVTRSRRSLGARRDPLELPSRANRPIPARDLLEGRCELTDVTGRAPREASWRAVDAEGEVLDVLVQSKRNKHAALKLMRKLLKKYAFVPERLVTDDLR